MTPTTMTDIDYESIWTEHFLAEVDKRKDTCDFPPEDWRASGRASKKWPNKEDATWWLTEGPAMLEQWHAWWTQAQADGFKVWTTPTGLPAVELSVNVNLGGQMMRGYIDAILVDPEGDLVAVDWKSGSYEPPAPIQLGAYKVAVEKTFKGVEVKYGAYYMARKGDLSNIYDLSIYNENLLGRWLKGVAKMQELGIFIPHPSNLCGGCAVRPYCVVMSEDPDKLATVPQF